MASRPGPEPAERFPDAATLAVCERFSVWLRRGGGLSVQGRPLPWGAAPGLDFEGFAGYRPGMDTRHLDWTVYARTRGLVVREYADEGAGLLCVLVDASGSMAQGEPSKWGLARSLAAALCFAALREVHQVLLGVIRGGRLHLLPAASGLSFAHTAFAHLAAQRPEGPSDLGVILGDLGLRGVRARAALISDFLDPAGADRGLLALARQGVEVEIGRAHV